MKKILLILLVFITLELSAQTTHDISWERGATGTTLTIAPGDTVRWTWTDNSTHNVRSTSGPESFSSEFGTNGMVFTHTFNIADATTSYVCDPHSGDMNGAITTDSTLSTEDIYKVNLKSFPNPVLDELTITSLKKINKIEDYSMLGKKVLIQNVDSQNITGVKMGNLATGLYFVNVTAESGESSALRVMKK